MTTMTEQTPTISIKDLYSVGTLFGCLGGRWSGGRTGRAKDLGLSVARADENRFSIHWTLIPSEEFASTDSIRGKAYRLRDRYGVRLPIPVVRDVRLVGTRYVEPLKNMITPLIEEFDVAADRFCFETYPNLVPQHKARLHKVAERFYTQNVEGRDGAPDYKNFLESFDRFLSASFPSETRLRSSMYLRVGDYKIDLSSELDQPAMIMEIIESMLKSLYDGLESDLTDIATKIADAEKYGENSRASDARKLRDILFQNVLSDSRVESIAKEALSLLTTQDASGIKANRKDVSKQLQGLVAKITTPTDVTVKAVASRLAMGQRKIRK